MGLVMRRLILLQVNNNGTDQTVGAQWLTGRVLDSRPRGCGVESHRHHCVASLRKKINPSLVLVQPRSTLSLYNRKTVDGT